MAHTHNTLKMIDHHREEVGERLGEQLARLRAELTDLASTAQEYGRHHYSDLSHQAAATLHELRRHLPGAAEELSRQARQAGRAVRNDPVPLLVTVGTIALLTHLFSRRS